MREAERKERLDAARPNTTQRGYGGDWQRLRKLYLAQFPYCSVRGCMRPAVDVDHITDIRSRPDLRLQWWNLRGFCHPHHSQRTARDQGFARRAAPASDDGAS